MPHAAQELLSGKYTPTLCQVIPIYKELLQSLQELHLVKIEQDKPQIWHAIGASIKKIEDYVLKAWKNHIYVIAMGKCHIIFRYCLWLKFIPEVINPACKLLWMEEHWSEEDVKNAKEWSIKIVRLPLIYSKLSLLINKILLQMHNHQTTHRHTTTPSQRTHLAGDLNQQPASATASSNVGQAIHRGMKKLCALRQAAAVHRTGSPSSNSSGSWSSTPAPSAEPIKSEEEKEWHEQVNNLTIVKDGSERYIPLSILKGAEADNLDLDLHWEVSIWLTVYFKLLKILIQLNQHQFPYLCLTALDILPAQASSVDIPRMWQRSVEMEI